MTFGCIGDGKADDTDGVQKHFDYGVPLPEGRFRILRPIISRSDNARLVGHGRRRTTLVVTNAFPRGKEGVVWVKHTGVELRDFGVSFTQTGLTPIEYPPAIRLFNETGRQVSRCEVSRILIESAWDGIICDGNVGGLGIDTVECGAFHTGISIDGALDAVFVGKVNLWPFGFAGTPLYQWYQSQRPVGLHLGRIDDLNLGKVALFQCSIIFDGTSAGGNASVIGLDGAHATLTVRGERVNIGQIYSTSNDPEDTHILIESGLVTIGQYRLAASPKQTAPIVHVKGGVAVLSTGIVQAGRTGDVVRQEGGRLTLMGLSIIQQPTDQRNDWHIHKLAGSLVAVGCTANQQAPGISSNAVKATLGPSDSLTGCVWPGMKCEIEEG